MQVHFRLGPWLVRSSLNTAFRNGTTKRLTPKAMDVLVCLAEHAGEPVAKEKLIDRVWPETFVGDDALKGLVAEIRRVLEDNAKEPRIIETIAKRGYRLVAPVEWLDKQPVKPSGQPKLETVRVLATPNRKLWASGLAILASALFLMLFAGANVARVRNWLRPRNSVQIHSIAVLPLRNLSADANQEYLCDGLTDGLITDLAQIASLKVISHTSTMQYKDTKKSLPEIARELNVDGIIEGTVQRSGDRVRITAQFIHGPSDKHVWANTYERDIGEVFALERDLTDDVTRQIHARITDQDQKPPPASLRPVNPKVLEAYLQGNYQRSMLGRGSGDEAARRAAAYFQQAIDADPSFTPAYLGLSWAHSFLLWPSRQDAEIDKEAVERAVALDPTSSEAHQYLGGIKLQAWDWAGAEQEYRRAIALSANNSQAHESLGHLLSITGRLDEGWREQQIAQELDPDHDHLSEGLALRRQYDREIAQLQMMLKRDPDDGYLHLALYPVYLKKGMYRDAIQQLERAIILFGYPQEATQVRRAFAVSGHRAAIREFARALEHLMATAQVFAPVNIAEAYAILGDKDRAFYWLEQAYARHDIGRSSTDVGMDALKSELLFDPIRSDPRFTDLLRRIGLPP